MSDGIKSCDSGTFFRFPNLEEVDLGHTLMNSKILNIGSQAADTLKKIKTSSAQQELGYFTFRSLNYTPGMTMELREGVKKLGTGWISNCNLGGLEVTVPQSITDISNDPCFFGDHSMYNVNNKMTLVFQDQAHFDRVKFW